MTPTPTTDDSQPLDKGQQSAWYADRKLILVGVRFGLIYTAFMLIISFVTNRNGWAGLASLTATSAHGLIVFSGLSCSLDGIYLNLANRTLVIDLACTAIFIMAVYVALVLAYPVSWRMRLLGIVVGLPVVFVFNLVRIAGAAYASVYASAYFTFIHDYVFEVFMVLVLLIVWVAWLSFVRNHAR